MTERLDMYHCDICGNLVQVILAGGGELVCCGKTMELMHPNTTEETSLEKHVPVYITNENGTEIHVGATPHPMEDSHYIMFIESISEDKNRMKLQYLHPGEEAKMLLEHKLGREKALEFCNIHGLWEGESD